MRYNLIALIGILLFLSSCQKERSFEVGPLATGSLQNDAGDCLPKTVAGNYIAQKALNDTNYIEVTIEFTKPGHYRVFTDTVNGYSFSGQGTAAAVGPVNVQLKGIGTPQIDGTDNFTVFFDSSSCAVQVTVLPSGSTPPPPASGVYFPMTANSWWSYDDGAGSDTIKITANGTKTLIGKTYQMFITTDDIGPLDTSYFRKDNATGSYYTYQDASDLSAFGFTFSQPGLDVLFLKDALTTNAVFNSDHAATLQGFPTTIRFKNTVLDANASITINGKDFTNVYKIQTVLQMGVAGTFQDMGSPVTFYFAKDIGLIKAADTMTTQDIRNWKVN